MSEISVALARVDRWSVAVPTTAIDRIDVNSDIDESDITLIDLRRVLRGGRSLSDDRLGRSAIRLRGSGRVLLADVVSDVYDVDESCFLPLPRLFERSSLAQVLWAVVETHGELAIVLDPDAIVSRENMA